MTTPPSPTRRKLIEVALPLEAINAASAREKSIRHGHPSTLHLWWARRPLATARAVLFAQLVDDPNDEHAPQEFVDACKALTVLTPGRDAAAHRGPGRSDGPPHGRAPARRIPRTPPWVGRRPGRPGLGRPWLGRPWPRRTPRVRHKGPDHPGETPCSVCHGNAADTMWRLVFRLRTRRSLPLSARAPQ